jgi:hypothetical protein
VFHCDDSSILSFLDDSNATMVAQGSTSHSTYLISGQSVSVSDGSTTKIWSLSLDGSTLTLPAAVDGRATTRAVICTKQ